jgi:glutamate racemase
MGRGVRLVDSAEETAKEVELLLKRGSIVRKNGKGAHSFFVTDAPERFIKVGRRFLGEKVESAVRIER